MYVLRSANVNVERLHAEIGSRVVPADDRVQRATLPLDSAAQHVMGAAIAMVRQRKGEVVTFVHVLLALCDAEDAFLLDLLARCGSNVGTFRHELEKQL
jgi:hypothetical protein